MPDLDDDTLDDIDDTADDNGFVRIKRDDLKSLRASARKAAKLERETAEWRREKALTAAGLTKLKPAQVKAVLAVADSDDPDALKAAAEDLFGAADKSVDAEVAQHGEAEQAVQGAPPAAAATITPTDAAAWPPEQRMRFYDDHPAAYEALLRGETIPTPTAA